MKSFHVFLCTAAAVFLFAASSPAQILSVDFSAQYYSTVEPGFTGIAYNADLSTPYTIGSYWLTAMGVDTGGASSPSNPVADAALWKDFRFSNGTALTLTIGGLTANAQYTFQGWSWRDGLGSIQTVDYTPINGTGGSVSNIVYDPNVMPVDLASYTTVMNLTSNASGEIALTIFSNTWNGTALNGFTLTGVPEPGTYALLGLGLLITGIAVKRRLA